jgi:hypothetical protein
MMSEGCSEGTAMSYDLEIYRLANILLQRYGAEAPLIAARRADMEKESFDPSMAQRATLAVLAFGALMVMLGSLIEYYHLMA